jgi:hypothetical protein
MKDLNMIRILTSTLVCTVLVLFAHDASGDDKGETPSAEEQLLKAVACGNLVEVKKIATAIDLDQLSKVTNLSYHALASPNADVVEFLRNTCDFSITDLQIAAIRGDVTRIKHILGKLDQKGRTSALAAWYGPPISSYSPLALAVRNGHADAVGRLIAFGANVNEAAHYTFTPLANAAERGHVRIVKRLLKAGANVNSAPDGYTALMRACWGRQPKAARLLLQDGADPNLKRHDGQRALHFAAKSGSAECVKLLLEHGANISAVTNSKDTALTNAEFYKHEDVVKLLRAKYAE